MSRFIALGGTLAVALLLVGAGCAKPVDPDRIDDDVITMPGDTDSTGEVEYKTQGDGVIELKATAVGTRQVKFEWELSKAVNEPTHFILLRGDEETIEHDQKTFWFRQHGTKRVATWVNLPPGEQFFRLCASNDKETCDVYSDALKVDVLSGPTRAPKKVEEVAETETEEPATEEMVEEEVTEEVVEEETTETPTTTEDTVMEDTSSTSTENVITDDSATSTDDVVLQRRADAMATANAFYAALAGDDEATALALISTDAQNKSGFDAEWNTLVAKNITSADARSVGDSSGNTTHVYMIVVVDVDGASTIEEANVYFVDNGDTWELSALPETL